MGRPHAIGLGVEIAVLVAAALGRASAAAEPGWEHHVVDPAGSAPRDPWLKAAGDLSGDGRPDLIVGGHAGGGLVWYGTTGRMDAWARHEIAPGGGFGTDAEAADIDRDGDLDVIAIRGEGVLWYESPGWKPVEIGRAPLHDIEVADLDGDGRLDVVGRNQGEFGASGRLLHVFRQVAPDRWAASSRVIPDGEGLLALDLDRDGDPDVALNGMWLENRGPIGEWEEHRFAPKWTHQSAFVAAGDLDRDGRVDLVLAPSELAGQRYRLSWFAAPADPRSPWEERVVLDDVEAVHHFVGVADFDGDGEPDIATSEMHQGADPDLVSILRNAGRGASWTRRDLSRTGSHSLRIADLNGDGLPDVLGANHSTGAPGGAPVEIWVSSRPPLPRAPSGPSRGEVPRVSEPSEAVRAALGLSPFYKKHADAGGLAIVGSEKVSDFAILEARYIVLGMLSRRPEVLEALAKAGVRLAVMDETEVTTDIPEHSDLTPARYWDRRARGLGATRARPAVSCAEENLLGFPGDPYATESILVHEFAHTIHEMGLRRIDPGFEGRLRGIYRAAMDQGLWKGTYAATNAAEYWAEGVQSWFDTNRPPDRVHNDVDTREELDAYDPDLAKLISESFRAVPWRYVRPRDRKEAGHLEGFRLGEGDRFEWREERE